MHLYKLIYPTYEKLASVFRNRKKINVIAGQINKENLDLYLKETVDLYNKAYYEDALLGFDRLSEYNDEFRISLVPHLEICRRIKNINPVEEDKIHSRNQIILRKFGWVDYMKYFTALVSFGFFLSLISKTERNTMGLDLHFSGLVDSVLVVSLVIITIAIHIAMKKYAFSKDLIRCKYCGRYTQYVHPDAPTPPF